MRVRRTRSRLETVKEAVEGRRRGRTPRRRLTVPAKAQNSYTDGDGVETKFDSYSRVELTDCYAGRRGRVTDEVERLGSSSFDLAFYGLWRSATTSLEFTATDAAGNAITDEEVKFEVLPRGAYEIDLRPGWNLVSFPGEPVGHGH